jgi:hypothetical protein
MKNATLQKFLSWAIFALALALLHFGGQRRYQVYYDRSSEPPPVFVPSTIGQAPDGTEFTAPSLPRPLFALINDGALVVNTTFTGVVRRNGNLYWTYDPSEKQGKQACPT